jgi:hypothetical protein
MTMNENTGYWCTGCGTPLPFGTKLCGGAACFNMSAETGQGRGADRPSRSPKLPRGSGRAFEARLTGLGAPKPTPVDEP